MNIKHVAEIGLKILGLFTLLQMLAILPNALSFWLMTQSFQSNSSEITSTYTASSIFLFALCALYLGISFGLLLKADRIADFLIPKDAEPLKSKSINGDYMPALAFQLMGIYALILWLPELVEILVQSLFYNTWQNPQAPLSQRFYQNWSHLISPACGSILGLVLVFKFDGLVRLLRIARPMDKIHESQSPDA